MDLYPAIDLRGGHCVRLVEGDFGRETVYDDDPVAVAARLADAGARWIHVVDLDAARSGEPVNRSTIAAVAAAVAGAGVRVQSGGGVRRVEDAAELLEGGVERVVLGTAAVENPALIADVAARWPDRVAVGFDHRAGEVRLRGWAKGAGRQVADLVPGAVASGAAAVIVTDIARDGRLSGPDLEGLAALLSLTPAPLVASGGIRDLTDLAALAALEGPQGRRISGAIVGTAIYEGALDVAAAVTLLAGLA